MRFSLTSLVIFVAVAAAVAVSAGVYPAKTGDNKGRSGRTKGGSGDGTKEDDRFHLQSPDGQYVFGHTTGNQGRAEIRTKDGTVTGYYSYVSDDGKVAYTNYVADQHGYRVVSNTGVPSASVTVEGADKNHGPASGQDFQKIFADFTKRIREKIVSREGQKVVEDPSSEGQHQVIVDPIVFPTKETKPSKHEEHNIPFPDWNQVKISTAQKSTDGIEYGEGQQQQQQQQQVKPTNPNWDNVKITTQRSNEYDNDGQGSSNTEWSTVITTETASRYNPMVPNNPQVPTRGDHSDTAFDENRIHEITTETTDSRIGNENSATADDTENNSPAAKPVSPFNDAQTTILYDRIGQTTENSVGQRDFQTTISEIQKLVEKSSTATISEGTTENYATVRDIEENSKIPVEKDFSTTVKPLNEEPFSNAPTTEDLNVGTDFQTTEVSAVVSDVDYTTIKTRNENAIIRDTTTPAYVTTVQPADRIGDVETATGVQRVTTERNEDLPEFRTLEPSESIGTTFSPNSGQSEAQEQEVIWPEIPQEPVPQVLVPIDPYVEIPRAKNAGVKTHPASSRPVRQFELDEAKPTVKVPEIEVETSTNFSENSTLFDFPTFFVMG